ncbi:uncharacterized protein AB675_1264 [Cyphellophora attinorum]|uniref:Protein SYG1-like protein n=1 Tax=Cyphellophora attinorum TaxID=1664694 RepID=A0A0N1NWB3_9EURO|nr:uncharacterized protein AB675_1264 [Phialophora attinorum]KPI35673.1 hypothetical protein AB675_1264 [Phialophora attinorum]
MKFAKELDDDLVPEWRSKYLNYKGGKKRIKAVTRALREAAKTPSSTFPRPEATPELPYTHFDYNARRSRKNQANGTKAARKPALEEARRVSTLFAASPPVLIPDSQPETEENSTFTSPEGSPEEETPLQPVRSRATRYGSIIGSPPSGPARMPSLDLPDPALATKKHDAPDDLTQLPSPVVKPPNPSPDPYHIGKDTAKQSLAKRMFLQRHRNSTAPSPGNARTYSQSKLRRMFTSHHEQTPTGNDVQLEAYEKLDAKQDDFFSYLDKELKKVEEFYKFKEDEANDRLMVLRKQLHELRDHRLEEVRSLHKGQSKTNGVLKDLGGDEHKPSLSNAYGVANLARPVGEFVTGKTKIGRVTKSLQQNASPEISPGQAAARPSVDNRADFVRRQQHVPSYRVAKRRLKLAVQEYYRSLELLKSYALLNQTAFRKINKKYDKAINARPPLRYYSEYVQDAYFVKSDVIGNHMVTVEDLYSRYFEKGNHKIAVRKLRSKLKEDDTSDVTFRNGLWLAAGGCLGVAGLVDALRLLFGTEGVLKIQVSYLLQLYAGYFLALSLGLAFIVNCRIWKQNRVNYAFVFEFDPRHTLDWRQLAEPPCFLMFLLGLFLYINFRHPVDDGFFLYYPVILISLTLLLMVLPFKIFYPQARKWWAYSNWRLLCAGIYNVEFRDFYLGDMYTSATYSMSQIALFFCLYSSGWNDPPHCNSNHSRLLGFFTTFPAILRAFQCIRRFWDSGSWFPHMANFVKYCGNIMYYMSLSLYRIDMDHKTRAVFITFAAVNSVYCTIWDIFMDWSLGDWIHGDNKFLRSRLAFKKRRYYYVAMVLDIILRQQWIVYAIFVEDLQHSSAASFFVGFAEVIRRGMWSIFRVENEHCNNVGKFRAYRDVPLPYKLPDEQVPESQRESMDPQTDGGATPTGVEGAVASGTDLERQRTDDSATSTVRNRFRALARVATAFANAHGQDYEKKKRPTGDAPDEEQPLDGNESSDDDDDPAAEDVDDEFRRSVEVQDNEDVDQVRDLVTRAARTAPRS